MTWEAPSDTPAETPLFRMLGVAVLQLLPRDNLAFGFGVGCFRQRDDRRLKVFMALECLCRGLHVALLGQGTAVASALVSLGRSVAPLHALSSPPPSPPLA